MQRRIVEPADVSGSALTELKGWLGITRPNEDALLVDLLHSGLAMCEAFTGQLPLGQVVEERVSARAGRYTLQSRPVTAIAGAEAVARDGNRTPIDPAMFEVSVDASGRATFALFDDADGQAVAIRMAAGRSASWDDIPAPLKQGIVRLCAYYYRDRDRTGSDRATSSPPASVSALWRPFQTMRLA